ncbi:MAG: hypothetical protein AAF065_06695 [Verrucomicrobiota bacterium]
MAEKNKARIIPVLLITGCFVAAFFVLRALPDAECGFLHYVEIVNEDGEIELCATNHAGFIDLSRLKYPINIELAPEAELQPGTLHNIELDLETEGGMPIAAHELAITHTKKMHVMLVDPSLEDYHHVHPASEGFDGHFHFSFKPERSGTYRVFTEIVPNRSRRQAIATAMISVEGEPDQLKFTSNRAYTNSGVQFRLLSVPDKIQTGRDYLLRLNVTAANGDPIKLEEIMGAKGHMVAFDFAGKGFAHMHPMDSIVEAVAGFRTQDEEEDLEFLFNVPNPGDYRLFAQIQVEGQAVFGRFDLRVE